jgi:dienelactone hydrolase
MTDIQPDGYLALPGNGQGAGILVLHTWWGLNGFSHAAYLGHFAETDEWVAASGVKKPDKSLRAAQRPATFYTYKGAGHWFFEKDRVDAYNPKAARLAWQRTVAFLRDMLAVQAPSAAT